MEILAASAINQIIRQRILLQGKSPTFNKTCYIIDQFKRPEEVDLFRNVYGKLFFQVSVFSKRNVRVDNLARAFAEDASKVNYNEFRNIAEGLVIDDENQIGVKEGQRVSKAFHEADFIINQDYRQFSQKSQIDRFVELIFSSNKISPSKIEYGMYAAKAAALRSADLSRQVGAAIFKNTGEIISMGSNEVPKANGGTYWCDEVYDDREFVRGKDSNDSRKSEILKELLDIFETSNDNLTPEQKRRITDSSLMDALEYGRVIHAEMSALTDAARLGLATKCGVLFTTTFPCHMCAKHIVSSGLSDVFYLEPYPKSLAMRLHSDSISIDGQERGPYRDFPGVVFEHFFGITPRRYREIFERGKRKNNFGDSVPYANNTPKPFMQIRLPFYSDFESHVAEKMSDILKNKV